jgi:16S rRNA U1498 N3-methylase RsmE
MKKFYVDFVGWCEIEAEDEKEARCKFETCVAEDRPLPCNIYEVQGIKEKGIIERD